MKKKIKTPLSGARSDSFGNLVKGFFVSLPVAGIDALNSTREKMKKWKKFYLNLLNWWNGQKLKKVNFLTSYSTLAKLIFFNETDDTSDTTEN